MMAPCPSNQDLIIIYSYLLCMVVVNNTGYGTMNFALIYNGSMPIDWVGNYNSNTEIASIDPSKMHFQYVKMYLPRKNMYRNDK